MRLYVLTSNFPSTKGAIYSSIMKLEQFLTIFCFFDMLTCDRVFCKKLQSDEAGFLVFTEEDVNCCVDITSTKDFKYITVNSNTRTSSEVGFL